MSRHLVATTALRYWLCKCLVACFTFPTVSHHLYGTVKAFHQVCNMQHWATCQRFELI
jgi:hypothetical protein